MQNPSVGPGTPLSWNSPVIGTDPQPPAAPEASLPQDPAAHRMQGDRFGSEHPHERAQRRRHHREHDKGVQRGEPDRYHPHPKRPAADPAQRAAQMFAHADQNGDGVITQDELQALMNRRGPAKSATDPAAALDPTLAGTAALNADAAALPLAPTASSPESAGAAPSADPVDPALTTLDQTLDVGYTLAGGNVADLPSASDPNVVAADSVASDPAAIKADVLAQLAAMQQDPQFASQSAEAQQAFLDTQAQVNALDPADPDFLSKLDALVGDPTATDSTATADPAAIKADVLDQLAAMQQDPQFAAQSAEQQQAVLDTQAQVSALDPADPDFMTKLQALVGGGQ